MRHSLLLATSALALGLSFTVVTNAAPATVVVDGEKAPLPPLSAPGAIVSPIHTPSGCLNDVRAFNEQMQKDGYWLGGSAYGYGYPMGGFAYGAAYPLDPGGLMAGGNPNARPGYEIRILVASANILAQHGQQQSCEDTLTTLQGIYKTYLADMKNRGASPPDTPGWQARQISSAQPVATAARSFRSDQLIDTDVRNAQNEALGSVHDIIMSPKSGKIAYLVIGRGGIFGIGEKYVPVPWDDFKITANVNLLVLDTSRATMKAAPEMTDDQFLGQASFNKQSQIVDAYWKHAITITTAK